MLLIFGATYIFIYQSHELVTSFQMSNIHILRNNTVQVALSGHSHLSKLPRRPAKLTAIASAFMMKTVAVMVGVSLITRTRVYLVNGPLEIATAHGYLVMMP